MASLMMTSSQLHRRRKRSFIHCY